jgi:hypothetical protein
MLGLVDLAEMPFAGSDRHPWERARARFFERVLERGGLLEAATSVLDVGAGDAWLIEQLLRRMPYGSRAVAWDAGYAPHHLAELTARLNASIELTSVEPAGTFSLILLLDVLEHIEDDRGFLSRLARERLAMGGSVLISVPAGPRLFTSHDVALGHFRRYRPEEGCDLVQRSGLRIRAAGGVFHGLVIPRLASKLRESILGSTIVEPKSLQWNAGATVTRLVDAVLAFDNALSLDFSSRGWNVPGLSWWAICDKP